ncbi:MAG: uroporphyrinogen-III synthase [Chloroflexi bacterium]|nr:uroporphyrinogen-III synthase [Chloroflexota bacterium]
MNDAKPLAGVRIAVTRALHQAPPFEALIREWGGIPVPYPCIAIEPSPDPRQLADCLRRVQEFDWLLLTSGNTVRAIAECLAGLGIALPNFGIRIGAAGPATAEKAQRLLSCGIHHAPAEYGAAPLVRSLPLGANSRILLPQSDRAAESTAEALRSRGASVTSVVAYRTVMGEGGVDLPAQIAAGEIDALSFTSPSAVAFFRRRCPMAEARELPALCIGTAAAAAAHAHGFQRVICPAQPTLLNMLAALADCFASTAAKS